MNISEVLNYVYQVVLPYASMLDGNISDCSIGDILFVIYIALVFICFLISIYSIPHYVRWLDPRKCNGFKKTGQAVIISFMCLIMVVASTFFGVLLIPFTLIRWVGDKIITYSTGEEYR